MRRHLAMIFLTLISCSTNKIADTTTDRRAESKIFMGMFTIARSKTDSATITINIDRHFWAEGKLQEEPSTTSHTDSHYNPLTFIFFDNKNRTLKTLTVANPLRQDFEYYSENGKLEKKTVSLPSAPMMIRTELKTNLKTIKIVDHENKLLANLTVTP